MSDATDAGAAPPEARPRIVRTEELFGAQREVIIKHREEEYRLRITRSGKLILTK